MKRSFSYSHLSALSNSGFLTKEEAAWWLALAETRKQSAAKYSKEVGDFAVNSLVALEHMEKWFDPSKQGDRSVELHYALTEYHEALEFSLVTLSRNTFHFCIYERAKKSRRTELLFEVLSDTSHTSQLIAATNRCLELEPDEWEGILSDYAQHIHALVEHLIVLCEKHPDAVTRLAGDYPHWPYLLFDRKSSPSSFRDLAQKIGLGKTCIVNADEMARYQWATPMNRYVFNILWQWQDARRLYKDAEPERKNEVVLRFLSDYSREPTEQEIKEADIFVASMSLEPLVQDKRRVAEWARKFIMPLIKLREKDFAKVPEFATALRHSSYATRSSQSNSIRKAVEESLFGMARPGAGR